MSRIDELRDVLRKLLFAPGQAELHYRGPADFVLQHGEVFDPIPLPDEYDYAPPKLCYANAIMLAEMNGLEYVEGYAFGPGGLPIMHAWNTDASGRLIDVTWRAWNEQGRHPMPDSAYLGVRFSIERADDAIWNGDGCVLDDWQRRWPLLREPWEGEHEIPGWQPSPLLEALRSSDPRRAVEAMLAAHREELASGKA
jgi:hypothetical protein